MSENKEPRLLTIEEFAARLGNVAPRRVRRWIQEGRLPHVRLGRVLLIPENAVQKIMAEVRR